MPATTTTTTTSQRKLSARRGSISASDPYGAHAQLNHNPNRSSSSILTIFRVHHPPIPSQNISLREPPSRRNHRRQGSAASTTTTSSSSKDPVPSRLSFAFSSFSPAHAHGPHSPTGSRPESPTSPRPRPASPSHARHSYTQPRPSPDQLLGLARASSACSTPLATPGTPSPFGDTAPASFTPLAADVYLPFIDRPAEVAALLASAPSCKLFSLLAQTFPHASPHASPILPSSSLSSSPSLSFTSPSSSPPTSTATHNRLHPVDLSAFPPDPTTWTYAHLLAWLTRVPRTAAGDAEWVARARACIMGRSELIWERVKGALGVPPELDMDASEDEGSGAGDEQGDVFADWDSAAVEQEHDRASGSDRAEEEDDDDETAHEARSLASPLSYDHSHEYHEYNGEYEYDSDDMRAMSLSIENIMDAPLSAPPALSSLSHGHSPLAADAAGGGLQDISEDQEDEDAAPAPAPGANPGEDYTNTKAADHAPALRGTIQGLKISTAPLVSAPAPASPAAPFPFPAPSRSPRASFALPALGMGGLKSARSSSFGSTHSNTSGTSARSGASVPYDPVGERGPGNPLFPSNFARLAVGPTLRAK